MGRTLTGLVWVLLVAASAPAEELVIFDLSSAFNVDQIGNDAERLEALAWHQAFPTVDYALHDLFGDHWLMHEQMGCYYSHDTNGLPTSGQVVTSWGRYQLGPASAGDVTLHQRTPNAVAFGKFFGAATSPVTVALPPAQQGRYRDANFLLVHWYRRVENGAWGDKRIRIWARYQDGGEVLLYEGNVLSCTESEDAVFCVARLCQWHLGAFGSNPRGVTILTGTYRLWEFRQPPALDAGRTLVGFRFEGTENETDAEDLALILAGSGHGDPPAEQPIQIAVSTDWSWCYQNTPVTTVDRHKVVLTVQVVPPDLNGNSTYSVQVTQTSGPGQATIRSTQDPMVWEILGGRRGESSPGAVELTVSLTGNEHGGQGQAALTVDVCQIGDIDGNGLVNASDKLYFNRHLNGTATPYPDRAFDLTGDGLVNAVDKLQMNRALNGAAIP